MKLQISSYKPTEFKKGYLRINGSFIRESSKTKNHRFFTADVKEGAEIDARGSVFMGGSGQSKWNAPKGQWAKFEIVGGELIQKNYDGQAISTNWAKID